ncbi:MAG: hypothetical protein HY854_04760 [Burkholderiales bacterium]|nr:hypothetical protein [Burkholderiales bacterium]
MYTKTTLTTLAAAVSLVAAGLAFAQGTDPRELPPSSTAGNGCTATANAMRGGNMSASPTAKPCIAEPAPIAAAPAVVAEPPAVMGAAPAPAAPAPVAAAPTPAPAEPTPAPMLVAKADRN